MRKTVRFGLAMAAAVAATPVLGIPPDKDVYDPGAATTAEEASTASAQDTGQASAQEPDGAPQAGAGGMEPMETATTAETREERDEQEFVNEVWHSP